MQKKNILPLVLLIAMLGAAAALSFHRIANPRFDLKPEQALGEVVAAETASLLRNTGQIAVVGGDAADPLLNVQIESARSALSKNKSISVALVERLKPMDPLLRTMHPGSSPYLPGAFEKILRANPKLKAVISFVGLPVQSTLELAAFRQNGGKIIAVFNSCADPQLAMALEQRCVDLAIVTRDEPPSAGLPAPKTARDLFNRYYQMLAPN